MSAVDRIATQIVDRALFYGWKPTVGVIQDEYGVSRPTARKANNQAKAHAADRGVAYGFDPEINAFRVAPDNLPEVAERMAVYVLQHWREAGQSASHLFRGLHAQGITSEDQSKDVTQLARNFDPQITRLIESMAVAHPIQDHAGGGLARFMEVLRGGRKVAA